MPYVIIEGLQVERTGVVLIIIIGIPVNSKAVAML